MELLRTGDAAVRDDPVLEELVLRRAIRDRDPPPLPDEVAHPHFPGAEVPGEEEKRFSSLLPLPGPGDPRSFAHEAAQAPGPDPIGEEDSLDDRHGEPLDAPTPDPAPLASGVAIAERDLQVFIGDGAAARQEPPGERAEPARKKQSP